ncbi:MAG TPA: ubiquitin-like small modifier protein 1 [Candidatus Bathyarchaeia archaeon]|nr:ubiquitin-like small modifier protein 1 [Candidatus Bathyarchaeia archaeon]
MSVKLKIPTALRHFVGNQESVQVQAATVGEAIKHLLDSYPALKHHIMADNGDLRNFVNVYVNDQDIRNLKNVGTPVKDGDTVTIVPAIAGGNSKLQLSNRTTELTQEEMRRYGRHLIMPEVGLEGQKKLKAGKVLVIGTGGLGSPLSLYLAAAGVGRLGLVDFDQVDASNLQRQVLYSVRDVGRPKLEAAKDRILELNPNVKVDSYETRLTSENAMDIIKEYDVVVDGTDNFPTRYLVNDACVLLGKPNVYGSIFRFEGQISVFDASRGPCYRCLYPEPPPPGLVPSCAEGGVLGILPGVVGTLQATETLKILLGKGDSLVGRLLLFDALQMQFTELKLQKNLNCPVCGNNPTVKSLIDYEEFCGVGRGGRSTMTEENEITVQELKHLFDSGANVNLIDVREPHEYEICHIKGSKLVPVSQIPLRVNEFNLTDEYIFQCHTGGRSGWAVNFLRQLGFKKVKNLTGGIEAWAAEIDPSMPRY